MTAPAARNLPGAGEISERLARHMSVLTPELLPAGRRVGRYWSCGSVANERGSSLWIHLDGSKAGHWQDGATGEFGDALDLVAAVRFAGDKKRAYAWGLAWLGLGGDMAGAPVQHAAPVARADGPSSDDERRRRAAHGMWLEAQPVIAGTPVAAYLAARGVDLAELGRQPRALRFHPSLPHRDSRRSMPAMVAAIVGPSGEHAATHRTWLEFDGHVWRKARVPLAKMTLGTFAGGSIRIWRGASKTSLRDAPEGEPVVIGEGIETCLSIAVAVPEMRVLCGVSLGNMGAVALPPQVTTVILAAENDTNPSSVAAFARVMARHIDAGRIVRVARPDVGKDFNDTLMGWGKL